MVTLCWLLNRTVNLLPSDNILLLGQFYRLRSSVSKKTKETPHAMTCRNWQFMIAGRSPQKKMISFITNIISLEKDESMKWIYAKMETIRIRKKARMPCSRLFWMEDINIRKIKKTRIKQPPCIKSNGLDIGINTTGYPQIRKMVSRLYFIPKYMILLGSILTIVVGNHVTSLNAIMGSVVASFSSQCYEISVHHESPQGNWIGFRIFLDWEQKTNEKRLDSSRC